MVRSVSSQSVPVPAPHERVTQALPVVSVHLPRRKATSPTSPSPSSCAPALNAPKLNRTALENRFSNACYSRDIQGIANAILENEKSQDKSLSISYSDAIYRVAFTMQEMQQLYKMTSQSKR